MYSFSRRVTVSDCGPNQKMSVHGICTALSDCEQFQNDNMPLITDYCSARGIGGFIAYRQAEIHRLPVYGEEIVISAHLFDLGPVMGHRNAVIESAGGERLVTSYSLGIFVFVDTGKPARMPDELIKSFAPDTRYPIELLPRKIAVPDAPFLAAAPVSVPPRYIDLNMHMNNVHYATLAFDAIGEPMNLQRIRIEYKTAAKQGDIIRPQVFAPEPSRRVVVLAGEGGTVHANAEFYTRGRGTLCKFMQVVVLAGEGGTVYANAEFTGV
ncbi:MAG: thioesterase [Firmicutes bacterium]|nr:thioesterase [Bacillota bacterium]